MAGDFNSNTRMSFQQDTHPQFVDAAKDAGLISVYHQRTGEKHGKETVPTYRHNYATSHAFRLDYCFASEPIANAAKLRIADEGIWTNRSDHYPLIMDVDDSALQGVVQA